MIKKDYIILRYKIFEAVVKVNEMNANSIGLMVSHSGDTIIEYIIQLSRMVIELYKKEYIRRVRYRV